MGIDIIQYAKHVSYRDTTIRPHLEVKLCDDGDVVVYGLVIHQHELPQFITLLQKVQDRYMGKQTTQEA